MLLGRRREKRKGKTFYPGVSDRGRRGAARSLFLSLFLVLLWAFYGPVGKATLLLALPPPSPPFSRESITQLRAAILCLLRHTIFLLQGDKKYFSCARHFPFVFLLVCGNREIISELAWLQRTNPPYVSRCCGGGGRVKEERGVIIC